MQEYLEGNSEIFVHQEDGHLNKTVQDGVKPKTMKLVFIAYRLSTRH
jgi:hypothetical protein